MSRTPMFPQLRDAAWLREQYEVKQRSQLAIAEGLGCAHTTVRTWLCRAGIPRRTRMEHIALRKRRPRIYSQLGDATWLRDQYETKRKSLSIIANELGCSSSAVSNALTAHGIARRVGKRPRRHMVSRNGS